MSWIISIIVTSLLTISASQTSTPDALQNPSPQVSIEKAGLKTVNLQTNALVQQQERIDQTYPLNANSKISLNNVNGGVIIEAWDKPEARVEAVKTIDCDKPYQIDVNIEANPNSLQIETDFQKESYAGRNWSNGSRCREARVDYKLTVPRTARLDEIETVNGNITLGGTTDFVKASTINGRINASNLRGTINLSSVNGTLAADFESMENVREVKIGMVNGKIDLQLPSDIEATLKADTVNGAINNDFGLPVHRGEYVGRNLYGKLGNGGITVKLDGVNGTINIRRKQDGRNPKPVTNLLPAKGKDLDDDEDKDDDNGGIVRAPRPPRAPRAPRPPRASAVVPEIETPLSEIFDESIQREIRKSVAEATKLAEMSAKVKIDKDELDGQIRDGLEDARQQMAEAMDFSWNNSSESAPMAERESKTLAVEGTPKVTIEARGGAVSIRGWERAEVSYSIGRQSLDGGRSAQAVVSFEKKGSDINVIVPKEATNYRLEIYVPRNCNLRVASNRQIRVEGVKGKLNLDGGEQSIDVRDSSGNLSVRADNGRVRVIGFEGTTEVKTLNGDIALEGNFSALNTDTVSGTTSLVLSEDIAAEIQSSTKNVSFDGVNISGSSANDSAINIWQIGGKDAAIKKYNLKTSDGKIFVRSLNRVRVARNNQTWVYSQEAIWS